MRLGNSEWILLIVLAVAWLFRLLTKHRSAGEGDEPPPVPKPKRRPQPRREPVGQEQPFGGRQAVAHQIRELVDQIRRGAQPPAPAPGAPAPIRETVSAPRPALAAPPLIRESAGAPPPKLPLPSPSPIAEPQPTSASVWAEALRDKQTLRRIIIAAEIIGPPKGV